MKKGTPERRNNDAVPILQNDAHQQATRPGLLGQNPVPRETFAIEPIHYMTNCVDLVDVARSTIRVAARWIQIVTPSTLVAWRVRQALRKDARDEYQWTLRQRSTAVSHCYPAK